jgi:Porphobilinogen deaminase
MSLNPNGSQPQHETEEISSRDPSVVVGCRKSELALTQTRTIISELKQKLDPCPTFEIATSSVVGDADKQTPFILLSKQTGGSDVGKSLWTNGLEKDLAAGKVQFLIHCLKDMPTMLPPNFPSDYS